MSTTRTDLARTCLCSSDPDVDALRELMARGFTQHEASRALWSPETPIARQLVLERAAVQTRAFVRRSLAARLPWLRLPQDGAA